MKRAHKLALTIGLALAMFVAAAVVVTAATTYPESSHPYSNSSNQTWTYDLNDSSVSNVKVTFSSDTKVENNYDKIYIYQLDGTAVGTYTGTQLASKTITVQGEGFKIKLTSDGSVNAYGFRITNIVPTYTGISIAGYTATLSATSKVYDGTAFTPNVTVADTTGKALVKDTDYTVSYSNNVYVGTGTVTIRGIGKYAGTITKSITIEENYSVIPESSHNYSYNTNKTWTYKHPDTSAESLKIVFNSNTYVTTGDYIYIYKLDGTQVGYYTYGNLAGKTVIVPGNGFKIKLTSDYSYNAYGFKIDSIDMMYDLTKCTATLSSETKTHDGKAFTPTVTVANAAGTTLNKDVDYTVSYSNNINIGTGTVTITGIGDYTGTITKSITIEPDYSIIPESSHNYSSNTNKTWIYKHPDKSATKLKIKFNSQTKVESNYDYIYIYTLDDTLLGRYTGTTLASAEMIIDGYGFKIKLTSDSYSNYYGFKIDSITKVVGSIANYTATLSSDKKTYDGTAFTPTVTLKDASGKTLVKDTDYTVAYANNIEEGTGTVTITGIGLYYGTITKSITIEPNYNMIPESSHNYGGYMDKTWTYIHPEAAEKLKVTFNNNTYVGYGDYIYIYDLDGVQIGRYQYSALAGTTLTIDGSGFKIRLTSNYSGGDYGFKIDSITKVVDLSGFSVALSETTKTYDGNAFQPTVTVTNETGTALRKDTDYTVEYSNNVSVGRGTVTITGIGAYEGTIVKGIAINACDISTGSVALEKSSYTYNGTAFEPGVTVSVGGAVLSSDNYTVEYSNNVNAGTATVTITGTGNYQGTVTKTFTISKVAMSKLKLTTISKKQYTGKYIKPTITLKSGDYVIPSSNYKVTYSKNISGPTAYVTITGKNNVTGTKKTSFKIYYSLNVTSKNMYEGKYFILKLNNVKASKVKYSTSKKSVCTVSSSGKVTGKKKGTAYVYVKYKGKTYSCKVKVLEKATTTSSKTTFYKNHSDVPDFGALMKITPTKSYNGSTYVYSLKSLRNVDPNKESGSKYRKLLVKEKFTYKGVVYKSGKKYYKYVSQKKIVYFGDAVYNGEVKIIIDKK